MTVIFKCRLCRAVDLISVLNLGNLSLSGKFVRLHETVQLAPVNLVKCSECGMLQLEKSCPQEILYGAGYGYESHLNSSMVKHLTSKAQMLENLYVKSSNAKYLDIASNDGTLLSGYQNTTALRIGIDPAIPFVSDKYPQGAIKIPEYFSYNAVTSLHKEKFDLITSCSVLYDLEDPMSFVRDVSRLLKPGGVWHSEQSYLPLMVKSLSYDTICHEHLLYLTIRDINRMCIENKLVIVDANLNNINGGSIEITAQKRIEDSRDESLPKTSRLIELQLQEAVFLDDPDHLASFADKARSHMTEIRSLLLSLVEQGKKIYGLGASTKGNILLQACGIDSTIVSAIGDVNPRKYGRVTPGTNIPIVPEREVLESGFRNSVFLILPWHFRENIISKVKRDYPGRTFDFLFPLPSIEIANV